MAATLEPPGNGQPATLAAATASSPSSVLEVDSIHLQEEDDWDNGSSSVTSSILDYEFENGRRYHAYKAGHYPLPNDESELDRLDLQHHVIMLLLSGELHLAPLLNPKRILDIGTGTGLWAIEMADRYPEAIVIGTDLSPTQPTWVPGNIRFEIDDAESRWTYREDSFDYIHSRYMIGAISNWKYLIRQAFKHCKPGGYFEIQELDPRVSSDDGSHLMGKTQIQWTNMLCEASEDYGRPVPRHTEYKQWFEEAGFVDVQEYFYKIPFNTWPKRKQLKEVGKYQLINYTEGCEGLCIGLFTRVLQWQPAEVQVLLAKLRKEFKDRTIHAYQPFAVLVGRKPENAGLRHRQMSPSSIPSSPGGSHTGSLNQSMHLPHEKAPEEPPTYEEAATNGLHSPPEKPPAERPLPEEFTTNGQDVQPAHSEMDPRGSIPPSPYPSFEKAETSI